jgi:hypothetical protein
MPAASAVGQPISGGSIASDLAVHPVECPLQHQVNIAHISPFTGPAMPGTAAGAGALFCPGVARIT